MHFLLIIFSTHVWWVRLSFTRGRTGQDEMGRMDGVRVLGRRRCPPCRDLGGSPPRRIINQNHQRTCCCGIIEDRAIRVWRGDRDVNLGSTKDLLCVALYDCYVYTMFCRFLHFFTCCTIISKAINPLFIKRYFKCCCVVPLRKASWILGSACPIHL